MRVTTAMHFSEVLKGKEAWMMRPVFDRVTWNASRTSKGVSSPFLVNNTFKKSFCR